MNNLVLDIHFFVSAVIQIFGSAQEELSKTDLLFQSYDNIFAKTSSLELKNALKNILCSIWTMLSREMKNLGDIIRFMRTILSN